MFVVSRTKWKIVFCDHCIRWVSDWRSINPFLVKKILSKESWSKCLPSIPFLDNFMFLGFIMSINVTDSTLISTYLNTAQWAMCHVIFFSTCYERIKFFHVSWNLQPYLLFCDWWFPNTIRSNMLCSYSYVNKHIRITRHFITSTWFLNNVSHNSWLHKLQLWLVMVKMLW